jgi:hypothetical protein
VFDLFPSDGTLLTRADAADFGAFNQVKKHEAAGVPSTSAPGCLALGTCLKGAKPRPGVFMITRDVQVSNWSTPAANDQAKPVLMTDVRLDLTGAEAAQIPNLLTTAISRGRRTVRNPRTAGPSTSPYLMSCAILHLEDAGAGFLGGGRKTC